MFVAVWLGAGDVSVNVRRDLARNSLSSVPEGWFDHGNSRAVSGRGGV